MLLQIVNYKNLVYILKMFLDKIKKFAHESVVDEILIFALIIAITETFAQNYLKNAERYTLPFYIGMSIYMVVGIILHFSYHHYPMSKLNTMWSCISIVMAITFGTLIYDEPLTYKTILSGIFALSAILVGSL